ncbi:AAA family ATPase [Streptomyces sp. NPDC056480]|uniref:AAA family ATPase n=1 Tax=Streptomyces sp. NPDC056480 TaxID=3345833 RepID=UPI00367B8CB8
MKFYVIERGSQFPLVGEYPYVVLERDRWDDFGFKTMFDAQLFSSPQNSQDLGAVKILKRGQEEGPTEVPDHFTDLGDDFCSLGQAYSYYELIHDHLPQYVDGILGGLRDVAWNQSIHLSFQEEPGFRTSLLRSGIAQLALDGAISLLDDSKSVQRNDALKFNFETSVGGEKFSIGFQFEDRQPLPGRMNVVIGYNGTGKTQLLANLANVAHADLRKRRRASFVEQFGKFPEFPLAPRFSSVIAISYSAFDTFDLPGENADEESRLAASGEVFGYVYCGLRKYERNRGEKAVSPRNLKSADEIQAELSSAMVLASSDNRSQRFVEALAPLLREPSFTRVSLSGNSTLEDLRYRMSAGLSTGHKMVLNIVVQLAAHLEPGSLVLIDEPETHLHPPLLAALLKSINKLLSSYSSYAVIATHSPVVLQEIPRRYVKVLNRFGNFTQVSSPEIETFGESVGALTRHAFSLDSSSTDYHDVLRELSERHSLGQVMEIFDGAMSAQALSYLISLFQGRGSN